jgi:hypothetical protein
MIGEFWDKAHKFDLNFSGFGLSQKQHWGHRIFRVQFEPVSSACRIVVSLPSNSGNAAKTSAIRLASSDVSSLNRFASASFSWE